MADTLRKASRLEFNANDRPTHEDLRTGCLMRIADATELMAKRHQELIDQKERAETSRDNWRAQHDRMGRRLIAARGQITKLKRALAIVKASA